MTRRPSAARGSFRKTLVRVFDRRRPGPSGIVGKNVQVYLDPDMLVLSTLRQMVSTSHHANVRTPEDLLREAVRGAARVRHRGVPEAVS